MSNLVKVDASGLMSLMHNNKDIDIPKPFEREIYLFDTHIAGTMHVEGIEEIEPKLAINDKLSFYREPENEYDKKAIVIKTTDGIKIGYVPQMDNLIFSRLMDAGKLLFARIQMKEQRGKWIKIHIKVFLQD